MNKLTTAIATVAALAAPSVFAFTTVTDVTFIDTSVGDADEGVITFDHSGVDTSMVESVDICFCFGVEGWLSYAITQGESDELEVEGTAALEFDNPSFGTTAFVQDIEDAQYWNSPGPIAFGDANASGQFVFDIAVDSNCVNYTVSDLDAFLGGAQTIDYSFDLDGDYDAGSDANPFGIEFQQQANFELKAIVKYNVVPEPTSGLLFGIGAAILLRRRRR